MNTVRRLAKQHASPRDIAQAADIGTFVQQAYKRVFGYRPELGEPDRVGPVELYHVHGFRFTVNYDGDLQVMDYRGRLRVVQSLASFKELLDRGYVDDGE